jgi:lipopolysaccharide/colanic/teichoic acid biosynthesis glycosyltransferase
VFFGQERYGWRKRRFRMHKFRTMVSDAEARRPASKRATRPSVRLQDRERSARDAIGAFLRKSSLDELPQLWNVLRGEMSLVGPRPLPIRDVHKFEDSWLMRRFSVVPGMTGLWQVSGRSELTFQDWVQLDLRYIDQWSLRLDFTLLLRTLPAVLQARGGQMTMLRRSRQKSDGRGARADVACSPLSTLALAHCASAPASAQSAVVTQAAAVQGFASSALRPGDALRVRIWREPDLSGEFTIDESGVVHRCRSSEPCVPSTNRWARSRRGLSLVRDIRHAARRDHAGASRARAAGAVKTPGIYKVEPAMTLADAIAWRWHVTDRQRQARQADSRWDGRSTSRWRPMRRWQDSPLRTGGSGVRARGAAG